MTAKIDTLYFQALSAAGLTKEQVLVYEPLIRKGAMQAGRLAKITELSRPYIYKILEGLIDANLVSKEELPGKPAQFVPTHPFAIQELARKQLERAEISKSTIQGVMGSLISDYTASSQIPGVRILQGTASLTDLYKDILHEKMDINLIRSAIDDVEPDQLTLLSNQIQQQVTLGIHTRIIGPFPKTGAKTLSHTEIIKRDRSRLTERRVYPDDTFTLPAQIIIYANKIALTSFKKPMITTIIENIEIRQTMSAIFELLWAGGKKLENI